MDNGVVTVGSLWADDRVYYPLAVEPFTPKHHFALGERDPAYRTEPQIALALVTPAVQEGIPFRAVVAASCYGENDTVRTGLAQLGVGYVLALRPSHAWWALVGTINSLVDVARAAAWDGPEQPGDWQPVERAFRDGHTQVWWALEVTVGPYGPAKRRRAVIVTTDPAPLPEHTTWYLLTNLPAPGAVPAAVTDLPAADLAAVVRRYGLRNWVEQRSKQVQSALGWNAYPLRKDHAVRRHWALVCCAFSFCWRASADVEVGGDQAGYPDAGPSPDAPPAVEPARGKNRPGRARLPAPPAARELAGRLAPGAGLVGAVDHARTLLARLVGGAPPAAAPGPARLAGAGPSHRAL